jgi:YfiH family protein
MTNWQWIQSTDNAYLTCDLLASWPHGFFTRAVWPQTPEHLTPILNSQAMPYRVKQVHGNQVIMPQQVFPNRPEGVATPPIEEVKRPMADGLMSDGSLQALWVCSADCNPVLIGDQRTGKVAAVHAGWRGTALKIVALTVEKFLAQGSRLKDLVVAIGPAISGEVYQVSTQVAVEVGRTIHGPEHASEASLIETILAMDNPPLLPDPEPGRLRLDVRRVNMLQLEQMGLSQAQIAVAPHCTFQEPERFFSYRRTREKKVQWSGIVSR